MKKKNERNGTAWHDMAHCSAVWCGAVQHGVAVKTE